MFKRPIGLIALGFVVLLIVSPSDWSKSADTPSQQETPATPEPVPSETPLPRRMNATWQDGLILESDDGDYRIQMGTFLRFDGRFTPEDAGAVPPNTFLMRTLRATFQGRIA